MLHKNVTSVKNQPNLIQSQDSESCDPSSNLSGTSILHYPDVYQPCKPVILQQTQVPNSLPVGVNYVDYEPQGTEVIQAHLQTTP